jgi:hypothetical protein
MPDGTPVRLAAGAHSSPDEGVCVVELASLIANEDFSDRPRCVCPVVGAFLRGWNDRAPHAQRQRLGPYAARIVGSRSSARVTRERRDLCLEWADAHRGADARGAAARLGSRLRVAAACGLVAAVRLNEGAGDYAARIAAARGDEEAAFKLLEELLALGERSWPLDRTTAAVRNGHRPVRAANGHAPHNGHPRPGIAPNGGAGGTGNGTRNNGSGNEHVNGNGYRPRDADAPAGHPASSPSEAVLTGPESG